MSFKVYNTNNGVIGIPGPAGDSGFGTLLLWSGGTATNSGQCDAGPDGIGGSNVRLNINSSVGSASNFFTALSTIYPYQTTFFNITTSTGQFQTLGISTISLSNGVYTISGGLVAYNGVNNFIGNCVGSYYVGFAQTGATGPAGP